MGRAADRNIVLVVEDEPLLRLNAVYLLEDAGFEVVEAGNAAAALKILESRLDIRLVFSDIDMPGGLDGMKLAALIRDRWPPVEIVLTSGHVVPEASSLPPRCVFYPKPYRSEAIVTALRSFGQTQH